MTIDNRHDIWVEKYRPQKIDDLILPQNYLNKFKEYLKKPSNILLCSTTPGTGKTSTLNAIIKEGNFESLFINASLENGIDILRGKIQQFASTESFDSKPKIVVLDEVDNFTDNAQGALRGFIEEFSINCRFILTCNYVSKIIPAIVNRFEMYDFDEITSSNSSNKEILTKLFNLLKNILENEKIEYEDSNIINVIKNYHPSIRGMISCLQRSSIEGKLNLNIQKDNDFTEIIEYAKKRDFNGLMKTIYNLSNADKFYEFAFKSINEFVTNQNKPNTLIILAKYQYQNAFVRDKNLNLAACLMELSPLL